MMGSEAVAIRNLSKSVPLGANQEARRLQILQDLSLCMAPGEFVAVYGPNGCGKTTLLNILGGLLDYDSGSISIFGQPPGRAAVGCVFQDYRETLFPWRRNLDNIALPLELRGVRKQDRYRRVAELEQSLDLDIQNEAYPYQCSGGEQQRVAIARALIDEPAFALMDEPFSALDFETRLFMHDKLLEIWHKLGTTILFVSHEIDEALYLADRIVFLSPKPAQVVEILPVTLPRPREQAHLESPEFFRLRTEALRIFRRSLGL